MSEILKVGDYNIVRQVKDINRVMYFTPALSAAEEKLLFYLFSLLKEESIIQQKKVYVLEKSIKEVDSGMGYGTNPMRGSKLLKKKGKDAGYYRDSAKAKELLVKKFMSLNGKSEGGRTSNTGSGFQKISVKEEFNVLTRFKIEGDSFLIEVNPNYADNFIYAPMAVGVSGVSRAEMKNFTSKYTARLERILKQKIGTGEKNYKLHIPLPVLRNAMLDNPIDSHEDKKNFRHRVLEPAIKELQKYSYLSDISYIMDERVGEGEGRVSFTYSAQGMDILQYMEGIIDTQTRFEKIVLEGKEEKIFNGERIFVDPGVNIYSEEQVLGGVKEIIDTEYEEVN